MNKFFPLEMKLYLKLQLLLILLILSLAAFLRLYNINQLFVFTIDEEYLFNIAQSIVDNFHIIWIGMTNSNDFSLGPLWIYFTSFFLVLGGNDPLILAYVSVAVGVLTTLAVFITGTTLFNFRVGAIASLLYAALPLTVFYDQRNWNNTLIPLMSVSLVLLSYLTVRSAKWWIGIALVFGLMFHTQISIFPYLLIAVLMFIKQRKKISKKVVLASLLVFVVLYSPLIAFDYFHKGSNITAPFKFTKDKASKISLQQRLPDHILVYSETVGRIWYLNPGSINVDENNWGCTSISKNGVSETVDLTSTRTHPLPLVVVGSLLLIIWFLVKPSTWKSLNSKLLAASLLLLSGSFLILPIPPLEYYLLPIFPLLVFIPAVLIDKFRGKWYALSFVLIMVVVILGINTILTSKPDLGIGSQKKIVGEVTKIIGDKPFALSEDGGCRRYAGWRYLFKVYGNTPAKSSIDNTFGWMYPQELSNTPVQYNVMVTEIRSGKLVEEQNKMVISAGGFRAYVTKIDTTD